VEPSGEKRGARERERERKRERKGKPSKKRCCRDSEP